MIKMKYFLAALLFLLPAALLVALPTTLFAQGVGVGSLPEKSPFRDLEFKQEMGLFAGWFAAGKDPAGAAPKSAPIFGVRYEVRISGPATFTARVGRINSKRTALDPTQPAGSREIGEVSNPIYLVDAGFNFNITGQKTWHNITPVTGFSLGVVTDGNKTHPVDPFKFGTNFEFSLNAGFRYVRPGSRWQFRGDINSIFYQLKYPTAYYTQVAGTQIVPNSQSKNFWKHNLGYTFGLSYMFMR